MDPKLSRSTLESLQPGNVVISIRRTHLRLVSFISDSNTW